ncbi:uncharacterized protein E0L32_009803 [Thyridium curvatum]|uniref:Uncharacterized protein n=1 Tax=Thyridium curvatum TaxID=1093900 RepID=A0A507AV07_9PEZI|nr:uncharacterized protein E0L32_009803 [Thyridium curvatum]TPX08741.1 hypothetical protein E0L32_009803 [Thyridium curvatum]
MVLGPWNQFEELVQNKGQRALGRNQANAAILFWADSAESRSSTCEQSLAERNAQGTSKGSSLSTCLQQPPVPSTRASRIRAGSCVQVKGLVSDDLVLNLPDHCGPVHRQEQSLILDDDAIVLDQVITSL